jgi:hypothetical protein
VRKGDQASDQVHPTTRHPDVGQDERRAVLAGRGHRVVPGGRLTDHAEVRLLVQQSRHGGPHPVVVVRDDDGDLTADWGRHDLHVRLVRRRCRDVCAPAV